MARKYLACGLLVLVVSVKVAVKADEPIRVCEQTLRVVRNAEHEPDADDRFLQAVLSRTDCELRVILSAHRVTLARRFELLRAGEIDLIIGVSRLPERESFGHFSVPFRDEITRGWIRKSDATRATGKSTQELIAAGWKVIGPAQGWFGPIFERLRQQPNGVTADYKRMEQGLRLLSKGRGDVLIADEVWFSRLPADLTDSVQPLPDVLHKEPLYVLYSPVTVTPQQVAKLDNVITVVRADWQKSK